MQLQADYNNVPQKKVLTLVIIIVSWAAALTGKIVVHTLSLTTNILYSIAFIGFLLAAFDSCRYRSEKQEQQAQTNGLREMYLVSGAAPRPCTTYNSNYQTGGRPG